jgi:DnaJ-domain-containing protein 1
MSLGKRLLLAARTELTAAWRKLGTAKNEMSDSIERELKNAEEELAAQQKRQQQDGKPANPPYTVEISRAYANLELPIGANASEVRAAYRRLMKRYHPDQHQKHPSKENAANELTRKLKDAHDQLITFLE